MRCNFAGISGGAGDVLHSGEELVLYNISRDCGDQYTCAAYNGVGTAAQRSTRVRVECKRSSILRFLLHLFAAAAAPQSQSLIDPVKNWIELTVFTDPSTSEFL